MCYDRFSKVCFYKQVIKIWVVLIQTLINYWINATHNADVWLFYTIVYFNKLNSMNILMFLKVLGYSCVGFNICLTSILYNKCVTSVIDRGSVSYRQWSCQSAGRSRDSVVFSHRREFTIKWTLLTCDGTMHLFVRSCGADNIFIVLINLQERYLIVGRFLFTSPLTRPRLIAPRSHFESENWMLFIILRRGCVSLLSLWRLWARLYDLLLL